MKADLSSVTALAYPWHNVMFIFDIVLDQIQRNEVVAARFSSFIVWQT